MAFLKSAMKCSVSKKLGLNLHTFCYSRPSFSVIKRHNSASSTAAATINNDGSEVSKGRRDPLDTSFNDPEASFKSKTTWEVLRAYVVYTLCSSSYLVDHNMQVSCSWFVLNTNYVITFTTMPNAHVQYEHVYL